MFVLLWVELLGNGLVSRRGEFAFSRKRDFIFSFFFCVLEAYGGRVVCFAFGGVFFCCVLESSFRVLEGAFALCGLLFHFFFRSRAAS